MTGRLCTITLRDEINCNIRGLSPLDRQELYEKWAITVHNAVFMPAVKQGKWDGKINFFKDNGNTYNNLLEEIVPWIEFRGYDIEVVDNRNDVPESPPHISPSIFSNYGVILRYYQVGAVNAAIDYNSGVLKLATAAGKTLINAALVHAYNLPSITIVPNTDLVIQTAKSFKRVGLDVGMYYGKKKETDHTHIISTWQSLKNNRGLLKGIQVIVVDECHTVSGKILNELLVQGYGPQIPFRFGLTGTIPKPKSEKVTLKTSIGNVIYEITAKKLIDEGYLAKLDIHIYRMNDTLPELKNKPKIAKHIDKTDAQKKHWDNESKFLASNKDRISAIHEICEGIIKKKEDGNTLILVDGIDFGKKLSDLLGCKFMYGDTDTEIRTEEYGDFEGSKGKVLMATYGIAKAGIDITEVHDLILIDVKRAFTRVIQSIGRGLRKSDNKKHIDIYDICSNSYYSNSQMRERMKYYNEERYPYVLQEINIAK